MSEQPRNPERTAWIILSVAFGIFCSLVVFVPGSLYWYAVTTTEGLPAEVTSVRGIVLIGNPGAELSSSVTDGATAPLDEMYTVTTDDTSQAILTFADDSSLTMYANTSIVLHRTQQPRFGVSSAPSQIEIEVIQGRVRATAARNQSDLLFEVNTPHLTTELGQGSFSIEVDENGSQVTARLGQAEVWDNDSQTVILNQGQRATVGVETPLTGPLPVAQNLLEDGGFTSTFRDSWEEYVINPIPSVTATASAAVFQNRPVLNLRSEGEDNVHTEVGVVQMVNKDVRDFQSLRVFAELRITHQSLPAGGQLGSEFPIMLHLAYRDAEGNDRDWFHGFYYEPAPENYILYQQPDNSSERIARFLWYPYESVNLLTTLGPTKPAFVKSIRIYASGWIYDAMVANISLLAEE